VKVPIVAWIKAYSSCFSLISVSRNTPRLLRNIRDRYSTPDHIQDLDDNDASSPCLSYRKWLDPIVMAVANVLTSTLLTEAAILPMQDEPVRNSLITSAHTEIEHGSSLPLVERFEHAPESRSPFRRRLR
jgi:hypothetical protein